MIIVSPAELPDVPRLAELFESYRLFYKQLPDPAGSRAYVEREVSEGSSRFFVARQAGADLLGFVHLLPTTNTLLLRPAWYLEDLFVTPENRRRGVGLALMQEAERFARESGAERLTLATAHDNLAAQALYRRLGYVREEHFWSFHLVLGDQRKR
jgi:ribosomal protein S18 acetylase RimI-like enzyme